jgi:Ser/Thr protein kinase RdoA (MazF antagonist)
MRVKGTAARVETVWGHASINRDEERDVTVSVPLRKLDGDGLRLILRAEDLPRLIRLLLGAQGAVESLANLPPTVRSVEVACD